MVTRTTVTLTDGSKAVKVEGLEPSAVYVRVRNNESGLKRNGEQSDIYVRAQAYQVNEDGSECKDGMLGEIVGCTFHNGGGEMPAALSKLVAQAMDNFVNKYESNTAVLLLPSDLPL
jgi:hypothetical protein